RRLGELCNFDHEIERTLRSIRAKRWLEFKQRSLEEMDDPPPANHALLLMEQPIKGHFVSMLHHR
ncbi:hypothetical protein Dimus_007982, partial [Dionaea muscipula]